jgi:hypothetical protein
MLMFSSVFSCFKHMFQLFHADVAYTLQWLHMWFSMFYLEVTKVDMVLYMLQWKPLAATAEAIVHARGKQRDGVWRGGGRGEAKVDGGRDAGGPLLCVQEDGC